MQTHPWVIIKESWMEQGGDKEARGYWTYISVLQTSKQTPTIPNIFVLIRFIVSLDKLFDTSC